MATKRPADDTDSDREVSNKRPRIGHPNQSLGDGISQPMFRSRSPATAHERRFLCAFDSCTSGANDVSGFRKHFKTDHEDSEIPDASDMISVPWMSWARGDYTTHPPTSQAKTAYLEQASAPPRPNQILRLRLALKRVVLPTPSISDDDKGDASDGSWHASEDRPLSQPPTIVVPAKPLGPGAVFKRKNSPQDETIIFEIPPTPAAPAAPSAQASLMRDPDRVVVDGPPAHRLRSSRNPSSYASGAPSRASSRAPSTCKPRKPAKGTLLNGRREFQKSRAWQNALCVAVEGLQREQGPEVLPTERERVLAKRIERDAGRIQELESEFVRLREMLGILGG